MKPEDVSQEAWHAALAASDEVFNRLLDEGRIAFISVEAREQAAEPIARAIMAATKAENDACAQLAHSWLSNWAGDLSATWESYIEAQNSGRHGGRRIKPDDARHYAKQFRERAEAVDGCADPIATAIRKRTEVGNA